MLFRSGNYWLTIPFKGKVLAYDRSGKRMQSIDLPVDLPTCCEFGGKDLDVLYVTSAILRRDAKALAGNRGPGDARLRADAADRAGRSLALA